MKITTHNPHHIHENATKFLELIAQNVAEELGIPNVSLDLHFEELDDYTGGETDGSYKNPYKVSLNIHRMSLVRSAAVLAHELVHVKQSEKGDLSAHKGYNVWKGQRVPNTTIILLQNILGNPKALPWEAEAYGRMKELAFNAFNKLPEHVKDWAMINEQKDIKEVK